MAGKFWVVPAKFGVGIAIIAISQLLFTIWIPAQASTAIGCVLAGWYLFHAVIWDETKP